LILRDFVEGLGSTDELSTRTSRLDDVIHCAIRQSIERRQLLARVAPPFRTFKTSVYSWCGRRA
jgi:hypothetical protein